MPKTMMRAKYLCLGFLLFAGCIPSEPGAIASAPRNFSDFDQFEYRIEGTLSYADAGIVGATIQRQSNGQYLFQATLLDPPAQAPFDLSDLTDMTPEIDFQQFLISTAPRELTQDEAARMRQVFSRAVINFTFYYPICALYVSVDIFRWDGFEIYANPSCSGPIQWLDFASFEEIMDMLEDYSMVSG